jgi:hypothetical protein
MGLRTDAGAWNADNPAAALSGFAAHRERAPEVLQHAAERRKPQAAPRRGGDLTSSRELRSHERSYEIFSRSVGQASLLGQSPHTAPIDTATVVADLHQHASFLECGAQAESIGHRFAERQALLRALEAVVGRVADDVHERRPERTGLLRIRNQAAMRNLNLHPTFPEAFGQPDGMLAQALEWTPYGFESPAAKAFQQMCDG